MSNKIKKMQLSKQPTFQDGFTAKIRLNGGIELTCEYGAGVIVTIPSESHDIAFETIKNSLASHVHAQKIHFNEKATLLMLLEALIVAHRFEVQKNISVDLEGEYDSDDEA